MKKLIKCQSCNYLFSRQELERLVILNKEKNCPSCNKKINAIKMLKQSKPKTSGFPCPHCSAKNGRADIQKDGNVYCKKCKKWIAKVSVKLPAKAVKCSGV